MITLGLLACSVVGGLMNVPLAYVVPFVSVGLLLDSTPRILNRVSAQRVIRQELTCALALTLFALNSLALSSLGFLFGACLRAALVSRNAAFMRYLSPF